MLGLSEYLAEVARTFARGDATEHTYRPALKRLIESLDPTVVATNEPRRVECGAPDFVVTRRRIPVGYIEAKDIGEPLGRVERSSQLKRYRESLGNLVLTDYLSFRWYVNGAIRLQANLGEVRGGKIVRNTEGVRDVEGLLAEFRASRVAVVSNPQELAERLAGLARLIRYALSEALREEARGGPLREQLEGFRAILLPDLTRDQFADIYAQTIVYGLFAARCNAPQDRPFTRERALFDLPRTNPFLRRLFSYLAGPELDPRLDWIVDDVSEVLDRTDIAAVLEGFGRRTRREDPVFHFYETFLATYDSTMREARGVYYTPEPVVSYIVRSVDRLLRENFGLDGGLANSDHVPLGKEQERADHRLLILDPAVGTGTFLYQVIAQIEAQVKGALGDGAWGGANGYVAQHLLPRIFGFELLMAPYTVAHMKVGLQLRASGYGFESDRRLGIYLTNSLEPAVVASDQYQFVAWLREEAGEASAIKRDRPVMVVLGNPPYSGHSSNKGDWITGLLRGNDTTDRTGGTPTQSYFHIDGESIGERNPKWLNDDYVKFIRFAQWRIDRTGSGILAFITNHGYLDNPTFRAMRRALMDTFDEIYVLDLHGNAKKKEAAPDGSADQNVFDIQTGVAIGVFVKHGDRRRRQHARIFHADLWGVREVWEEIPDGTSRLSGGKYHFLESNDLRSTQWNEVEPTAPFFSFRPRDPNREREWNAGNRLPEIMPINVLGFQTHRDHFAVDIERDVVRSRILALRDNGASDDSLRQRYALKDNRDWSLASSRANLRADRNWERAIVQCLYRPFDTRWCYFSEHAMDYPRRQLLDHVMGKANLCLLSSRQLGTVGFRHSWVSRAPAESCVVSTRTKEQNYVFPVYLYPTQGDLLGGERGDGQDGRRANFTPSFLAAIGRAWRWAILPDGVGDLRRTIGPEDVAAYIYALISAPPYRDRYAESLQQDYPRVMITPSQDLARRMIEIGHTLIQLHLLEGNLPTRCRLAGQARRIVEGVVFTETEDRIGEIRINANQVFAPVPSDVWEFQVGGFQVCDKWLKERQGRELTVDEVATFGRMVGAVSETIQLMNQLEEAINEAGGLPFAAPVDNSPAPETTRATRNSRQSRPRQRTTSRPRRR